MSRVKAASKINSLFATQDTQRLKTLESKLEKAQMDVFWAYDAVNKLRMNNSPRPSPAISRQIEAAVRKYDAANAKEKLLKSDRGILQQSIKGVYRNK